MTQLDVTGSCLCGSVAYSISGSIKRFFHCHCQRCRKFSGTGHSSNLLVGPLDSIRWTRGEELLGRFKVPDAERYFNCFCMRCGSPMPRVIPDLDGVMIPAGTLDDEPPAEPQGRIFWDSRAAWSCNDGLPVSAEYPEEK